MTTVRLSSGNRTRTSPISKHYIEIQMTTVTEDLAKEDLIEFGIPFPKPQYGTYSSLETPINPPPRLLLDLGVLKRTWQIQGYITRESSMMISTPSGYWVIPVFGEGAYCADVFEVRDRLIDMMEYGGIVQFTYGTQDGTGGGVGSGDGYYRTFEAEVLIDRISFTEDMEHTGSANADPVTTGIPEGKYTYIARTKAQKLKVMIELVQGINMSG